jgi:hypothetical protein
VRVVHPVAGWREAVTTAEVWQQSFRASDRRPIDEWASEHVTLPPGLPIQGRYDPTTSRHFGPIFAALADPGVREVVIRKPLRGGGTLISDIWHCWTRANNPGPMMAVLQSDEMAWDHFQNRLGHMFRNCPQVAAVVSDEKYAVTKSEVAFKDGLPFYIHGPGLNKLQTKAIRYMSLDEPWLYKAGTITEAEGRLGDYLRLELSKLLLISQAGDEGDDFDTRWQAGDQGWWTCYCAECAKPMSMRWSGERPDGTRFGMRWEEHKDERGHWQIERCIDSVRYECEHCGHPHIDTPRTKSAWNASGFYLPKNPSARRSRKSFHWSAIIDFPWVELVSQFLAAANAQKQGILGPMIQFFQKRMAEPKSEASVIGSTHELKRTAYDVQADWPEEVIRFMTVDRQEEDLYWVMVRAWSADGKSRRLWWGKLFGEAEIVAKAAEFKCLNVFVDSGFRPKGDHGVYAMCCRNEWVALKGDARRSWIHKTQGGGVQRSYSPKTHGDPESGQVGEGTRFADLIYFSSDTMADRLQALLDAGQWQEPRAPEDDPNERDYKKQMSSEFKKKKENRFTGRFEWVWVCPSGNNHAWDCAKMQVLAAILADVLPDQDGQLKPAGATSIDTTSADAPSAPET